MKTEGKQELIDLLKQLCPIGTEVSVQITGQSHSGLSRTVRVFNRSNFDITVFVALLLGTTYLWKQGFRVMGTSDARFMTIYRLSKALYGDGYELIWK